MQEKNKINNGKEILLRSRPSARDVCRWTESKLPIPVLFPSPPPRFAFHSFAACSARDITLTSESCAHLRRRRERARLLRRGQMVNVVLPCTPFAKEECNRTNRCISAGCGETFRRRAERIHFITSGLSCFAFMIRTI